ncbi:dipeptide transport system ATP-binding protein [Desulfuromusa kysingii]|uniref:Dipeptide transport system ATP-binding protein n=1 Tax=Desulfuromusa kysingii TaxID=37625 RepID=A0A1H3VFZ9_9BACT|nr:dipeptide ABC transporter ATP-binding protein [Desulfuromusa kysingii]SDZ73591.1 dipeptide transport system ATP-binding protein [Desulfuromusa kysingii]
MALLQIKNLTVEFGSEKKPFRAVDQVCLEIEKGEVLGIVGESGSGKSVTAKALMGLIDWPGRVVAEKLEFDGQDLQEMSDKQRRKITGRDIAMIFQEPMTSLNPCFTTGFQIAEALKIHEGGSRSERRMRSLELLEQVGIPDPSARLKAFPHQLSGGMSQRIMIAMAIACNPRLLIADEPTTALDVTIQAQIIDLLLNLQKQRQMALILITHDLALVAEAAHRIVVMYAGQVVETGPVPEIFETPRHPYTAALLEALPERSIGATRLKTIPGVVPGQFDRPTGCLLNPRCEFATERCRRDIPLLQTDADGRQVRCHTPLDREGKPQP